MTQDNQLDPPETPDWTSVLTRMTEAMESHQDWGKRCRHTPLENDLPVRAAKVALEIIQEMDRGR